MVRRIVMVLWGVIRRLLRLMRIIRCGALTGVAPLIRLRLVVWVARVCWVLARWVCVALLAWAQAAWVPLVGCGLVLILGLGSARILPPRRPPAQTAARARAPLVSRARLVRPVLLALLVKAVLVLLVVVVVSWAAVLVLVRGLVLVSRIGRGVSVSMCLLRLRMRMRVGCLGGM